MTPKKRLSVAIGAFALAVVLVIISILQVVQRGFTQDITPGFIAWLVFAALYLIASVVALVYYRAKAQIGNETLRERALLEAERHEKH